MHRFLQSDDDFAFDWVLDDGVEILLVFQEVDNRLVELLSDLFFPELLRFFASGMWDLGLIFA